MQNTFDRIEHDTEKAKFTSICAWCDSIISHGTTPGLETHGVCKKCKSNMLNELAGIRSDVKKVL